MGGGGWKFLMGRWRWLEVYFGWVGVAGHFLWVGEGRWTFFMGGWWWVGVSGGIFWVGGGGWTFFMGGWG